MSAEVKRGPSRALVLGLALVIVVLSSCCLASIAASVLYREDAPPSPFAGDGIVHATLTAEGARADADAEVMRQRIERMGLEGEARVVDASTIAVELRGVGDAAGALAQLRRRGALGWHAVDEGSSALGPDAVPELPGADVAEGFAGRHWVAPTAEVLAPLEAHVPEGRVLGVSCGPAFDEVDGEHTSCEPLLLHARPGLTNLDVAEASVVDDPETGAPVVLFELEPAGATKLGELTAACLDGRIAIVLDGRVLIAPRVMSRIDGGQMQISLGMGEDRGALVRMAHGIAAASGAAPLSREWELASLD